MAPWFTLPLKVHYSTRHTDLSRLQLSRHQDLDQVKDRVEEEVEEHAEVEEVGPHSWTQEYTNLQCEGILRYSTIVYTYIQNTQFLTTYGHCDFVLPPCETCSLCMSNLELLHSLSTHCCSPCRMCNDRWLTWVSGEKVGGTYRTGERCRGVPGGGPGLVEGCVRRQTLGSRPATDSEWWQLEWTLRNSIGVIY